jgi:hypothetical protein
MSFTPRAMMLANTSPTIDLIPSSPCLLNDIHFTNKHAVCQDGRALLLFSFISLQFFLIEYQWGVVKTWHARQEQGHDGIVEQIKNTPWLIPTMRTMAC